jgi:threonine/homoserine/homoserine lactone efflux protein
MTQYVFFFWGSFVVALSGAMMPGPMLTATVSEVMKRGFVAGPLVVVGHGILEILLLAALAAGLSVWLTGDVVIGWLGLVGGGLLVAMGVHMVWTSARAVRQSMLAQKDTRLALRGPITAGVVTSLSNPYWVLWWATIGLGYAAICLEHGILGLASFYTGHILADFAWYALVAGAVASSRTVCSPRVYRGVLVACGVALVGLGVWFLVSGANRLTTG